MRSDAQNLRVISEAIDRHKETCPAKLLAVLMNPFEVDRLGWDEIKGIPIKPDDKISTGRFRLACDGVHDRLERSAQKQAPDEVSTDIPEHDTELDPAEPAFI